jgi:predicted HTH domain antitoxin
MPLHITDEELQAAGLTAETARVELACRLFQAGKLDLWPAARLAGLSRTDMEEELLARLIPIYVVTEDDLRQDVATLEFIMATHP